MSIRISILLALLLLNYFTQARETTFTDSLQRELTHARKDTNQASLLDAISFAYHSIDPAKGVQYAQRLVKLSTELGWQPGLAKGYADLGINYEAMSDHTAALDNDVKALELCRQLGNKKGVLGNLANISVVYVDQSDYPHALDYALQALKISEEVGDKKNETSILSNIAIIYLEQKNYAKALQYDSAALNICERLHDRDGVTRVMGHIAIIEDARGNYERALQIDMQLLAINTANKNDVAVQLNLANIGYVNCHRKNYKQALHYQQLALDASRKLNNKSAMAVDLGNIGETYYSIATDTTKNKMSMPEIATAEALGQSITHLEQAIDLCRQTNTAGPLMEFTQYLSNAKWKAGDANGALAAYKQYTAIKDSLFSLENNSAIARLETERELEVRKKQIQIDQLEVEKKRDEKELYIAGIAVLLLVMGIVLKNLYAYRKSNRVLQQENSKHLKIIEEQVRHIKSQKNVLKEIANMQSHDVRGPVATILGLVQIFNFENTADPANKIVIEGIATVVSQLDIAVKEVIKKENNFERRGNEPGDIE